MRFNSALVLICMLACNSVLGAQLDASITRGLRDTAVEVGVQQIAAQRLAEESDQEKLRECGKGLSRSIAPVTSHFERIIRYVGQLNDANNEGAAKTINLILSSDVESGNRFIDLALNYGHDAVLLCESRLFARRVEETIKVLLSAKAILDRIKAQLSPA